MAVLAYFIKTDDFIQLQFRSFLLANVLNVILDVVFIKYLNMGIGGPGLATATSFIIGALYISTYFLREKGTLKIVKIKIKESPFISAKNNISGIWISMNNLLWQRFINCAKFLLILLHENL